MILSNGTGEMMARMASHTQASLAVSEDMLIMGEKWVDFGGDGGKLMGFYLFNW